MAKIIVHHRGKKEAYPLGTGPFIVGRAPECDLALDEPKASRKHCEFLVEGDRVVLSDLGSRNGTKVNGEPIQVHALTPGDVIKIGDVTLFFETEAGAQSGLVKCPKCLKMIPEDAQECPECGESMNELDFKPRCLICEKEQDHGGLFCIYCGAGIDTGKAAVSCFHCNQVLQGRPEECPACGQSPYPPQPGKTSHTSRMKALPKNGDHDNGGMKQTLTLTIVALAGCALGYWLALYSPFAPAKKGIRPAAPQATTTTAAPAEGGEEPE